MKKKRSVSVKSVDLYQPAHLLVCVPVCAVSCMFSITEEGYASAGGGVALEIMIPQESRSTCVDGISAWSDIQNVYYYIR